MSVLHKEWDIKPDWPEQVMALSSTITDFVILGPIAFLSYCSEKNLANFMRECVYSTTPPQLSSKKDLGHVWWTILCYKDSPRGLHLVAVNLKY